MPADVASMIDRGTSWITFARTPVTANRIKIHPSMKMAASATWYDTCNHTCQHRLWSGRPYADATSNGRVLQPGNRLFDEQRVLTLPVPRYPTRL